VPGVGIFHGITIVLAEGQPECGLPGAGCQFDGWVGAAYMPPLPAPQRRDVQ
jgi:hypothetical protein